MNKKKDNNSNNAIFVIIIGLFIFAMILFFILLSSEISINCNLFDNGRGSVFAGILTLVGVIVTINHNRKIAYKQFEMSNMPSLSVRPEVNLDKCDSSKTIFRQFAFFEDYAENDGWRIYQDNEQLKRAADREWSAFSLRNVGPGVAYQINIFIYKVISINKITTPQELINNIDDDIYDTCEIGYYKDHSYREILNGRWKIYSEFMLSPSEQINFVFNYDTKKTEISMLKINYKDSLGNSFYQKLFLTFDKEENKPGLGTISRKYRGD